MAAPPEPNDEVDIDMSEILYFRGEGELGPEDAAEEEQVAAPEEEQVAAPQEEQVAAPQEEQVAAQEEVVNQPQPLQEMPECWVVLRHVADRPARTRDERRQINEGAWNEEDTALLVKEIQKNYDIFYEINIGGKKGRGHCDMVRPTFDIATRTHKQCYRKAKQLLNKEKSVMLRKLGLSDTCARYYYEKQRKARNN